jgi:hypothetical protein
MIRTLRERRAALGGRLAAGVCLLLCMGAPALAAEAKPGGEPRVVGTLAAVAIPNFITYRNEARVAAGVATGESIRAAADTPAGKKLTWQDHGTCTGQAKQGEATPDHDAALADAVDPTGLLSTDRLDGPEQLLFGPDGN